MIDFSDPLAILAFALLMDAVFGEPAWLWARIPHPAVAMGNLIAQADAGFNREDAPAEVRRRNGVLFALGLAISAFALGWLIQYLLLFLPFGWLLVAGLASTLIAQKSLHEHVAAVATGLDRAGLEGGRTAVSAIVGRDPETLNEAGVSRAAIESTAENFADGVVAPVFWFAILGLGGMLAYKAVNTADSMIGHRTARHEDFGMGSARLDDGMNWIPARLSGFLIAFGALLTGRSLPGALSAMAADAYKHRSLNAGWPEAAMAGALGLALAGPRVYGGTLTDDPYLNAAGRDNATSDDIRAALTVMTASAALMAAIVVVIWIAI